MNQQSELSLPSPFPGIHTVAKLPGSTLLGDIARLCASGVAMTIHRDRRGDAVLVGAEHVVPGELSLAMAKTGLAIRPEATLPGDQVVKLVCRELRRFG